MARCEEDVWGLLGGGDDADAEEAEDEEPLRHLFVCSSFCLGFLRHVVLMVALGKTTAC